ncbi:MAG: hypothetical protein JOZ62_17245, partial [Acidobacteriaceae bacterium]|nr:hypothetical protein [Acidobacteriaceae bacterium]
MIRRSGGLVLLADLAALAAFALAVTVPVEDWKIAGPFGGTATTITIDPQSPRTVLAGGRSSLLFQSQDSGATWVPLDLPKRSLGEVTCILVDPINSNHYFVGMLEAFGGGIYETLDQGKTWAAVDAVKGFGVRALAASASNPNEFVAGTLHGVMLSADSG